MSSNSNNEFMWKVSARLDADHKRRVLSWWVSAPDAAEAVARWLAEEEDAASAEEVLSVERVDHVADRSSK